MPKTMQVVRGNLAAAPDYWAGKQTPDGQAKPSFLSATVYEERPRVRQQDGSWVDNPLGPVKTTVKFWGAAADIVHAQNMRQGDSVVVTGRMGEPDAYISERDGQAHARLVLLGDSMQLDAIMMARRAAAAQRREQQQSVQQQDTGVNVSAGYDPNGERMPSDSEFDGSFDQTAGDSWQTPQSVAPAVGR